MLDEELRRAASDLRDELQHVAPPPFKPRPQLGGRVLLVAATVAVFVIGFALVTRIDTGQDADPAETPVPDSVVTDPNPDSDSDGDDVQTAPEPGPAITDVIHRPTTDMARPQPGRFVLEPEFATIVAAVTAEDAGAVVTPIPDGAPSWNSDGSLLVLYETGALSPGHTLYDGQSFARIGMLPFEPLDIEQLHWDPVRPNRLYFVEGTVLQSFDIESLNADSLDPVSGTQTAITEPDLCQSKLSTALAHKPISADGSMIGLACDTGSGAEWIALNLETGETARTAATGPQAPIPTADGSRFVVSSEAGQVSVLDAALQPTGVSFESEASNLLIIRTDDGRDLAVTTVFSLEDEKIGSVIAFDLSTGATVPAVGLATGFPYPPAGTTMSTSPAIDGLVAVSIAGVQTAADQETLDGELLLVDFNTTAPTVYRLGHHRSAYEGADFDRYRSTPWTALSPDGSKVLFASHWGGSAVDTFVIDITNLRNP